MERSVALKRLRKMIGKNFAYEFKPNAPSKEDRELAQERSEELAAKRDQLRNSLTRQQESLLAQDPEYQLIKAELSKARKALDDNNRILYTHKITVGWINGTGAFNFFHVDAQGDSWEEIFQILNKQLSPSAGVAALQNAKAFALKQKK